MTSLVENQWSSVDLSHFTGSWTENIHYIMKFLDVVFLRPLFVSDNGFALSNAYKYMYFATCMK